MALVDRLLGRWHEVGITVVVASHQSERVARLADATLRLDGGLVAEVTGSGVQAGLVWPTRPAPPFQPECDRSSALARGATIALAIARKDALSELRGRQASGSTLFFAALVLLLFGFALGPDSRRLTEAAPGLLWLAIVFGGLLTVARLHQVEVEDGAMEQLALYPVDRRAIYAGKALAGAIAMLALGAVLLPVVAILYAIPIGAAWLPLVTRGAGGDRLRGGRDGLCRVDGAHAGPRGDAAAAHAADRGAPAAGRGQGHHGRADRRSVR